MSLEKISYRLGIEQSLSRAIHFSGGFTRLAIKSLEELFTQKFPTKLVIDQIQAIGVQSLVLVLITGLATGSVMALQFGFGLARFGGTLYVPKLTLKGHY